MNTKLYDSWSDEIDWQLLNERGNAVLRRRYIKDGEYIEYYMSFPDKSEVIVEGIAAFLFSSTFYGEPQLLPITFKDFKNDFDISRYFIKYYSIRKTFTLQIEKTKPESIHENLEKSFLLNHIKEERKYYKNSKKYFETIKNKEEQKLRKQYVLSYLKWIKDKKNPLKILNYIELIFWIVLCLIVIILLGFEFFWIDKDWNLVQSINNEYEQRDKFTQQILIYLIFAFIGSFGFAFIRIKKILTKHRF